MKPVAALAVCGLLACQSQPDEPAPALVDGDRAAALSEITAVVSKALGRDVLLADDVFAHSSTLSLEHRPPRTLEGQHATGTLLGRPEQFRLVMVRSGCALVHVRTGELLPLRQTACRAAEQPAP